MGTVKYPFGPADQQSPAYAAAIELQITNQETIVEVATLTGALALTAVIAADVEPGARLSVKLASDGTARNCTPGAGFTSAAISGTISKTKWAHFIYNGSTFIHLGTQQVD